MIQANQFLNECKQQGFSFFSGTPCSYLKSLTNAVIDDETCQYYEATNEGDAVAMVAGAYMSGTKGIALFQNSGLGNAVNAITSLCYPFKIPLLLIVTLRGEPGGEPDEPQHELMGQITTNILSTMKIDWEYFPQHPQEIIPALQRANQSMDSRQLPYAFVMKKNSVAQQALKQKKDTSPIGKRSVTFTEEYTLSYLERSKRTDALQAILKTTQQQDVLIATTGKTGRELFTLQDTENQLYMVGSMGSASSFSLGIALNTKQHRVICIDGDAALLMRMGNIVSIGGFQPSNLVHIVLDNEANDSTGGQSTPTANVSFATIAKACNYKKVYSTDQLESFFNILKSIQNELGPFLIHFRIQKGSPKNLGRPTTTPSEVRQRLQDFIIQ